MLKQNAFSAHAGTLATLMLGFVFSAAVCAADNTPTQKAGAIKAPGTGKASPAESFANSNGAYPPSCLNDGVPFGGSSVDPHAQTVPLTLQSCDTTTGGFPSEADSVSIWRVPCSGGVAATIVELDRPSALNGNTTQYAVFPNIYITSSDSSTTAIFPRLGQEPNTLFEDKASNTALYSSTAYVLEYYDSTNPRGTTSADYNQAFTLKIDNLVGGGLPLVIDVPAYVPPTTAPLMKISGYLSTNWSNPDQSGEGIVLQVYDNGDHATRTLAFAWFTYDDNGLPFWLYGQGSLHIGDTSIATPTIYLSGGTFAGSAGSAAQNAWGTVTFTFPDCGHMNIVYNGDASAVHGPTGNTSAQFVRVADVNGLVCQ
jgi:hypothetical protein